jgi:hypothetical protein
MRARGKQLQVTSHLGRQGDLKVAYFTFVSFMPLSSRVLHEMLCNSISNRKSECAGELKETCNA